MYGTGQTFLLNIRGETGVFEAPPVGVSPSNRSTAVWLVRYKRQVECGEVAKLGQVTTIG